MSEPIRHTDRSCVAASVSGRLLLSERLRGRPEVPASGRCPSPPAFNEALPAGWTDAQPSDGALRGSVVDGLQRLRARRARRPGEHLQPERAGRRSAVPRRAGGGARRPGGQFPTVTVTPSATRSGTGAASGAQRLYSIPIDVTYQADVWGSIRRSVAANAAVAQASAAELENARLLYQAELAADYFQIQGLDAERRLLDATVKSYEQYVQLTQDRFEGGVASMGDVALAQTQLETARAQLTDLGISGPSSSMRSPC